MRAARTKLSNIYNALLATSFLARVRIFSRFVRLEPVLTNAGLSTSLPDAAIEPLPPLESARVKSGKSNFCQPLHS